MHEVREVRLCSQCEARADVGNLCRYHYERQGPSPWEEIAKLKAENEALRASARSIREAAEAFIKARDAMKRWFNDPEAPSVNGRPLNDAMDTAYDVLRASLPPTADPGGV